MIRLNKVLMLIGGMLLGIATVIELVLEASWVPFGIYIVGGYLIGWGLAGWHIMHRKVVRPRGAHRHVALKMHDGRGSILGQSAPDVLFESPDCERYAQQARNYFQGRGE